MSAPIDAWKPAIASVRVAGLDDRAASDRSRGCSVEMATSAVRNGWMMPKAPSRALGGRAGPIGGRGARCRRARGSCPRGRSRADRGRRARSAEGRAPGSSNVMAGTMISPSAVRPKAAGGPPRRHRHARARARRAVPLAGSPSGRARTPELWMDRSRMSSTDQHIDLLVGLLVQPLAVFLGVLGQSGRGQGPGPRKRRSASAMGRSGDYRTALAGRRVCPDCCSSRRAAAAMRQSAARRPRRGGCRGPRTVGRRNASVAPASDRPRDPPIGVAEDQLAQVSLQAGR